MNPPTVVGSRYRSGDDYRPGYGRYDDGRRRAPLRRSTSPGRRFQRNIPGGFQTDDVTCLDAGGSMGFQCGPRGRFGPASPTSPRGGPRSPRGGDQSRSYGRYGGEYGVTEDGRPYTREWRLEPM